MPAVVTAGEGLISRQQLRAFHLTGKGLNQAEPEGPMRPALLDQLPRLASLESGYPVYLAPRQLPRPLVEYLKEIVERHASAFPILSGQLPLMAHAFQRAAQDLDRVTIGQVAEPALAYCATFLESLHVDGQLVAKEIARLGKELDEAAWIVPFSGRAAPILYAAAVEASRGSARAHFIESLKECRDRVRELLVLDDSHSPDAGSAESLSASLGMEASAFFSTDLLAAALQRPVSALHSMEADRRLRCEAALVTLDAALERAAGEPAIYFFSAGDVRPAVSPIRASFRHTSTPFGDAVEFCEQELNRLAITLRALRTARLEVQTGYEPSIHDELLERFDWQSADAYELAALPAIAVLESAERLAETSLTGFGQALRSGLPVQILVEAAGLSAAALKAFVPDFGYLAIAHREAFVLQSSLACPNHLLAGLAAMAGSLRTAVAVVSVPQREIARAEGWTETLLLYLSHAVPAYCYDPGLGESWPERFTLLPAECGAESGEVLNAVHAIAVSRRFRSEFRLIPNGAWDGEQMELREYLEKYSQRAPLAIPFLWILDNEGNPQRAVVTRDAVNLCRERGRSWRIYEEFAAIRSGSEKKLSEPPDADQAKKEGAKQAIYRIVAMLTDTQVAAPVVAGESAVAPVELPLALAVAPAAAEEAPADPYIDSFLCTSCNDCMKVNPRVFGYDGNKQAYIADARAGTFAELVRAAEGCPAGCIHPGLPRPNDQTATAQVLLKAAKFSR